MGKRNEASPGDWGEFTRVLLRGRNVLLLLGGMAISAVVGEVGIKAFAPVLFDLFRRVLFAVVSRQRHRLADVIQSALHRGYAFVRRAIDDIRSAVRQALKRRAGAN